MSRPSSNSARRSLRRLAVATVVAATGLALTAGAAGAAGAKHQTEEIEFTSHVYTVPQPDGSSRATLVGDTCSLTPAGRAAMPCRITVSGTIQADGSGVAKAVVVTRDRVIYLDEVFSATGPTTGVGSGSVKELGLGGLRGGTFTAAFELAPTAIPNVLLDWGTISITH